jgi:DNA-binding Xre family transcriptional regulator
MSVYRYNVIEVNILNINEILSRHGMTKYKLSKASGVPHTTISDICSRKTRIEKCSVETLYKISKVLGVSMEDLVEGGMKGGTEMEYRSTFDVFKSNVCHQVKDMGDLDFIIHTLESDQIRKYFDKGWYPESLYLLAMVDYLSRENGLPLSREYNDIRAHKLAKPLFPLSVVMADAAMKNSRWKDESVRDAIPEFMRFNIVESEVRNVF